MTKNELNTAFDRMTPNDTQKERMLNTILNKEQPVAQVSYPQKMRRKRWFSTVAACLALVFAMMFMFQPGNGSVAFALSIGNPDSESRVKIMDSRMEREKFTTTVSNVNSRPDLEFYIEGKDIAKIELSCENEYLYVVDWTKTQQEKYWNSELYQWFDEEKQQYVAHPELLLDKSCLLTFPEGFNEYDQIWYRWYAWDLYKWASADNFSHFQGVGGSTNYATEKGKLEAAGGNKSAAGHILLDGYPKEKLNDRITMTIIDRSGNTITKTISINISNNKIGQTVVTASLIN